MKNSTLSTFLVSQKNQNILGIFQTMLNNILAGEKSPYSPILIRGISGTGKTHLLHAFLLAIQESQPQNHVMMLSGRDFTYTAQSEKKMQTLIEQLKNIHVFCIDDVHFLTDSQKAQQELCYLIDLFSAEEKTMLLTLTSERYEPQLISPMQSRLSMGMVLELAEPDMDVRMRYALACFDRRSLPADREHALILARRCQSLRAIQGVVLKMEAFQAITGHLPDKTDMDRILVSSGSLPDLTAETIVSLVAARYGCNIRDIKGKKRDPRLVEARQLSMYLCRNLLGESYPALGRIFGGKDHSTVIYAVKKIEESKIRNKEMNILVTELTQSCKKLLTV